MLLLDKDDDFFAKQIKKNGFDVFRIYKNINLPMKVLRRLHLYANLHLYKYWFNKEWIKKIDQFDTILLHASIIKVPVVKFINSNFPHKRVILWYWNPVDKILPLKYTENLNCELWSFDPYDCKKYDLKYNTQFYFDISKIIKNKKKSNQYDVLFIGKDKGRLNRLLNIKKGLEKFSLKIKFNIVGNSKLLYYINNDIYNKFNFKSKYNYSSPISYEEVVEMIFKSRSILDIVADGQSGLTLRPLEAIFAEKKLITNDSNIKKYDFYNSNNIHILKEDDYESLKLFLNRPYEKIDYEILNKYKFSSWIKRFEN
jgi:hypothetical protein